MVLFKLIEPWIFSPTIISMQPHGTCCKMVYRVFWCHILDINDLALIFFNHFKFLVRYDVGTKLLLTFLQDKATHISDHIQEWWRQKRLIMANIRHKFLLEWFPESFYNVSVEICL